MFAGRGAESMISFNKKVSVVGAALVVCATLVGASVASAQGTGATKSLRSLGGPTRFTAPVRSVDALKRSMARRGIQRDIATILTKAGNPSVTAEVQRILAEGQVMASTLAPGTTIEWMALRRGGTRPDVSRNLRWDGRNQIGRAHV